ncbi:sterile alpha motif domain-containing protein 11 [Puma concolor]|uniref:Sterile alpha motif domain-containing protein 11 n=1 Tax=Puma concolor TaxID=9696 RepID=A0A6P6GXP5_PUMCO|nr:sterile alpha motif domain-containing protein 11 [Puma concolor]
MTRAAEALSADGKRSEVAGRNGTRRQCWGAVADRAGARPGRLLGPPGLRISARAQTELRGGNRAAGPPARHASQEGLPRPRTLALALAAFRPTLAALPLPPLPGYLTPLPASAALPRPPRYRRDRRLRGALVAPSSARRRLYLNTQGRPYPSTCPGPPGPRALLCGPQRGLPAAARQAASRPSRSECGITALLAFSLPEQQKVSHHATGSPNSSNSSAAESGAEAQHHHKCGRHHPPPLPEDPGRDPSFCLGDSVSAQKGAAAPGLQQEPPHQPSQPPRPHMFGRPAVDQVTHWESQVLAAPFTCALNPFLGPVPSPLNRQRNRGRLADKRTVALPTARVLKKELTTSFSASDGDSDGNGPAYGQRPGLKQEDTPHVRIMKRRVHTHWDVNISFRETSCSQDSDLPTLISSVHRSRHLVMPEHQSRCEFQRGGVEIGLGAAGDLLGKRPGRTPHVSGECPLEKKARSKPPQETLLLPELGPSMAPEDHYRRLVSALSEAGTFEDPQRLYHLGLPSHGTMGGLFMDGEEATAPEDLSKWTVDDVCSFVGGLSGCGEYAPVFREQGIDGETLPLLTEEHLLTTMGLKLGPALKIRAQVAKRLGRVFYMASFPVALPLQPPTLRAPERELTSGEQALSPALAPSPYGGGHPPAGRASPKQENGTVALLPGPADPSQPLC